MDIDPASARWGIRGSHVTGDILEVTESFPADFFDLIILNGVFGFGVDRTDQIDRCLTRVSLVLSTGGFLIIGWNTDKTIDPMRLDSLAGFHYSEALPFQRQCFQASTHVYDFLSKVSS